MVETNVDHEADRLRTDRDTEGNQTDLRKEAQTWPQAPTTAGALSQTQVREEAHVDTRGECGHRG